MVAVIQANFCNFLSKLFTNWNVCNLHTQKNPNTGQKLFWKLFKFTTSLVLTAWSPFNSLDAMSITVPWLDDYFCLRGICEWKHNNSKLQRKQSMWNNTILHEFYVFIYIMFNMAIFPHDFFLVVKGHFWIHKWWSVEKSQFNIELA